MSFYREAMVAGFFGCLSGVFGKLSTDMDGSILKGVISPKFELFFRIALFALNIICTGLMWKHFVSSMKGLSALSASVLNSGSNFICTALLGSILFNEVLSLKYFFGISLILTGLGLIIYGEKEKAE
jgi:drug/metabolite transporter (DMT)-like permease